MRSFIEVANCGSFTKAAEHLDLSRLQVSRHIQEIEQWLSLRQLHRTTRSVSLTLQGEEALQYCQRVLSEVAAMESRAHSHNSEMVGSIRIATPIGLGQHSLFDVVDRFVIDFDFTRNRLSDARYCSSCRQSQYAMRHC